MLGCFGWFGLVFVFWVCFGCRLGIRKYWKVSEGIGKYLKVSESIRTYYSVSAVGACRREVDASEVCRRAKFVGGNLVVFFSRVGEWGFSVCDFFVWGFALLFWFSVVPVFAWV